jgi:hypothetical protein
METRLVAAQKRPPTSRAKAYEFEFWDVSNIHFEKQNKKKE